MVVKKSHYDQLRNVYTASRRVVQSANAEGAVDETCLERLADLVEIPLKKD